MTEDGYNYTDFAEHMAHDGQAGFERFADGLHAGSKAPSFPLTRLDEGTTTELDQLWRRTPTVLEFGSFT